MGEVQKEAGSMGNKMAARSVRDTNSIRDALMVLSDAAANSKDEITDMLSRDFKELKQAFSKSDLAENVKHFSENSIEKINAAKDLAMKRSRQAARVVDQTVRERPWVYIGSVAAAGLVLGYVLGKSKEKHHHYDNKFH